MPERVVRIARDIDRHSAADVIMDLVALDAREVAPIYVYIYCVGGYWEPAADICNTILFNLKSPVITIGMHMVGSASIPIAMSGDVRLAFTHSWFNFHNGSDDEALMGGGTKRERRERLGALETEHLSYARYCTRHLPTHETRCVLSTKELASRIDRATKQEYLIGAETARRLGFLDGVVRTISSAKRYERRLLRTL